MTSPGFDGLDAVDVAEACIDEVLEQSFALASVDRAELGLPRFDAEVGVGSIAIEFDLQEGLLPGGDDSRQPSLHSIQISGPVDRAQPG